MKIGIFLPKNTNPNHNQILKAFGAGISKHQDNVHYHNLYDGYKKCDIMITFGIGKGGKQGNSRGSKIYQLSKQHNGQHLVIERGYIKRDKYYSVGWNGLNGRANFENKYSPSDRWEKLGVKLQPWKYNHDGFVLLCGQIPWDSSVQHTDHIKWCKETYYKLQKLTKRDVIFRPHPGKGHITIDKALYSSKKTLTEDLEYTYCVVTFNSNCGVEALINGTPVICQDKGSMIYDIVPHNFSEKQIQEDIEQILYMENKSFLWNRTQWSYDIAYAQWNVEEMESGESWNHISMRSC